MAGPFFLRGSVGNRDSPVRSIASRSSKAYRGSEDQQLSPAHTLAGSLFRVGLVSFYE
jgi:hypothetical protein